jgi:hypothetical protein
MMGQSETATQRDTATGTLPLVFASNGQIVETRHSGVTATLDGAEPPASILSTETLRWKELTYRDRTFEFNREIQIRVLEEDGGWTFESADPELMGYGLTRAEAELSFCFDFALCWREYACEEDSKLAPDAREFKQELLGLVNSQR